MSIDVVPYPRSIPPQPTVAWFLRDLVPDGLWNEFDIGKASAPQLARVRLNLIRHGGRDAWLRFVAETRTALPHLLSLSLFDMLQRALGNTRVLPDEVALTCYPLLTAYAGGRMVTPRIKLHCHVRLKFSDAGQTRADNHVAVVTEVTLRLGDVCLIERVRGRYFVPAPPCGTSWRARGRRWRRWSYPANTH
ncbi:hypothetical protein [Caballeronia sp. HLA56]